VRVDDVSWDEVLSLGDDALILAQRTAEWTTRAPELEEDVALANIALDLLGQARMLLTYAGELEGAGRDEDALAYRRDEPEFRNVLLVELDNGDFAHTMARLLIFSSYQVRLYERLATSPDSTIAAIAGKAVKEVVYHQDHAVQWTLRLGDGTEESHRRMQAGLDAMWPYAYELFEPDGVGFDEWSSTVDDVIARATLERPTTDWRPTGGRRGIHTEAMGPLLAEMQVLHRAHPGARW
jgi:ring-1,2-phenylacetyl-CoA epoxidase subunit PaaC